MNTDYLDPKNFATLANLADPTVALDFLLSVKSGVRNYAIALTESITPSARNVLHNQLEQALALHAELTTLMIDKGWFHPYNAPEQFQLDTLMAQTAVNVAAMPLYPETTLGRKFEL